MFWQMLYNHILYYQVLFMLLKFDFNPFWIHKLPKKSQESGDQNSAPCASGDDLPLPATVFRWQRRSQSRVTMKSGLQVKTPANPKGPWCTPGRCRGGRGSVRCQMPRSQVTTRRVENINDLTRSKRADEMSSVSFQVREAERPLENVQGLKPKTWASVTLCGKRDSADQIKGKGLKIRGLARIIQVGPISSQVLKSRERSVPRNR